MMWRITCTALLVALSCFVTNTNGGRKNKPTPPSGIHILDGICMPRRADRLVYRHRNDTHVYIAFDVLKKSKVAIYWWNVYKASNETVISEMHEDRLHVVDFRRNVNRDHILGATSKSQHKWFRTKIKRMMKKQDCGRNVCHVRSIMNVFIRMAEKIRNVYFNKEDCDT